MDEPTTGEIIRSMQADLRKLVEAQDKNITREIYELYRAQDLKRIEDLENGKKETKRTLATAFALPLLVILVAYALGVRA